MKLRGFVPLLAGLAAVSLVAGCGSSSGPVTQSSSGTTITSAPAAATSAPPTAAAASGSLTGTWSGSYTGAFTGSFTLNCTQSGSALSGSITLTPGGTETISG